MEAATSSILSFSFIKVRSWAIPWPTPRATPCGSLLWDRPKDRSWLNPWDKPWLNSWQSQWDTPWIMLAHVIVHGHMVYIVWCAIMMMIQRFDCAALLLRVVISDVVSVMLCDDDDAPGLLLWVMLMRVRCPPGPDPARA